MMTTISLKYHLVQPPFYGHYTGQLVLDGTSSSELEDFLVQSFTDRMPVLTATSAFGLGRT